jgi:hypothetical protein
MEDLSADESQCDLENTRKTWVSSDSFNIRFLPTGTKIGGPCFSHKFVVKPPKVLLK